jgi:D-proline reductase (dithiol) PrdB
MPIPYIQRTRERYAKFPPYKWAHHTEAPWAPLAKPITECRVALVSSGGFYLPEQPPFQDNDVSHRLIPKDTELARLRVFHHGYRDRDPDLDPNCVFPLDRLRELEATGVIGGLADNAVSFVVSYSIRRDLQERAPKVVADLQAMGVEAALCVPV